MLWVCNIVYVERRNFKHTFKTLIIFCHWLGEIYKEKRNMRFFVCCFKKLKSDLMSLIMLWYTVMSIVTGNGAKVRLNIWHLLEKGHYKHTTANVAVWLSCYAYIFAISPYLITDNKCLTIFSYQKLCVIGKICIRWSEKSLKPLKK